MCKLCNPRYHWFNAPKSSTNGEPCMSKLSVRISPKRSTSLLSLITSGALACFAITSTSFAQQATAPAPKPAATPETRTVEKPLPGLELTAMDLTADPCTDMYKYSCGNFNANHPIPAVQSSVD